MKRPRWRSIALLAALASLAIFLRVGWSIAQDRIALWIDTDHENSGWRWRLYGARRVGWTEFQVDSIKAWKPSLSLRIRFLKAVWLRSDNAYPLPFSAIVSLGNLQIAPGRSTSTDSTPPQFPHSLKLPLELRLTIDTLELLAGPGRDSGSISLQLGGVVARTLSARSAEASIQKLDARGFPIRASASAELDWTESDTLRAYLSGLVSTGCCEQDSVKAQASIAKSNLTKGRFGISTSIENTRGWSEALPALAKAPAAKQIDLDAWARTTGDRPEFGAKLGFTSDSIVFFPGMRFLLTARLDSANAALEIKATENGAQRILARLAAPLAKNAPPIKAVATGGIRIDGLGWFLREFQHPLDGTIDVKRIDRKGATILYRTDAGTSIDGSVVWKGLHWTMDAQIAPAEPWAVGWVNGLSILEGGHAHGSDSGHGALFQVTAKQPRMKVVALDSLSTRLWIGAGPHLVFSNIVASDSGRRWIGDGDISIPDSLVRFDLHPSTDSVATARLLAKIDGHVRISAASFPTHGLPLHLPFKLPFDGVVDGGLIHDPPKAGKSVSWVTANLRARPANDSLFALVELAILDSSVQLPRIRLEVGGSQIEGSLAASQHALGWGVDTLRLGTEFLDLTKLNGLWPGIPSLRGRLRGNFQSQRDLGVSASARLESPEFISEGKAIPLPDLLLWGERDTLHLGGWIPISGTKSPFHLTATHLWDPTPEFSLRAFWGDIVKLEATGSFKDKKDLQTSYRILGSTQLPGFDAHLNDILVTGGFQGHVGEKQFEWKAQANGTKGVLAALDRNPLDLRFEANANPKEIRLDTFSLSGTKNGRFTGSGSWDLTKQTLSLIGQAHKFRLDLGTDKSLFLDSLGVRATPDSRIRVSARDASWHQSFAGKDEKLDIGISQANLVLVQAKDWKKLSGDVRVDQLTFTKNFAQIGDVLQSMTAFDRKKKRASSSASSSLLLDIQATSDGDDIRVSNNLGQAKLAFDLQVTGPTNTPLLNGYVAADPDSGRFGYLRRTFALDTLRVDWNTEPVLQGTFALSGSHMVKKNCTEEQKPTIQDSSAYCKLILSSQGSLENPRLSGLTSECAEDPSDDGTVGAFVALATDCYPQPNNRADTKWGDVVRDGTIDIAYGVGMDWFNQVLMDRVRGSRSDAIWLPDSVTLTDFPVGGGRDQLGLLALYHISPDLDFAGVYRHTFTQTATGTSGAPVLADDYGLSLKYRIPFWWVDEERIRDRLANRVYLQLDANQSLDENSRRFTIFQPSLRYRWEFW